MSDPLNRVVLPADGQRSFEELQAEFREANRQRIRRMLRKDSLVRYHKDGTVAGRVETGLMTDAPAGRDWRTVKDFMTAGGVVPEPSGEFQVIESPGLDRELRDLSRDAEAIERYDGVRYTDSVALRGDLGHYDQMADILMDFGKAEGTPDGNPEEVKHAASDEQPGDESPT